MAVNVVPIGEPIFTGRGSNVRTYSPVAVEGFTKSGENFVGDLYQLACDKAPSEILGVNSRTRSKTIEGGRYVNFDFLQRLSTRNETEQAIAQNLLALRVSGDESKRRPVINQDGSITMPIGLVQTLVNNNTLDSHEQRRNAAKHGRAGLKPHLDTVERSATDKLSPFFIGGIGLSPGPFVCVIREKLDSDGNILHLPGATFIDGNRLEGIGPNLDLYTRHRQVEIVNTVKGQTIGNTYVTFDVYRNLSDSEDIHPAIDWWNMDLSQRAKIHRDGINPLDVIHASDPVTRMRLAHVYKRKGVAGVVMSAHGASEVPIGETDKFTAENVEKAAKSYGRNRELPKRLDKNLGPTIKALAPAGDRSRVFVGERLLADYMSTNVARADIRSFLVEDFGDIYMSQQLHSAMLDLVRAGVAIGWDNQGDVRHFHRSGYWIKPEEISAFENIDFIIAMYGTHRAAIDRVMMPKYQEFMRLYSTLMNPARLGVTHGNGPGAMRMSDVTAREVGVKSLGVTIEVEGQEEGDRIHLPNATAHFKPGERLYRQQIIDRTRIAAVINQGGIGSLEETEINVCTTKLHSTLPAPTILVDPDGDYYAPIVEQFRKASLTKKLHLFGKEIDISDSPMTQPWVVNTVHHVRDYDSDNGAFSILKAFWEDPAAYWDRAQIPAREVKKAYIAHGRERARMGMKLADNISRAVKEYTG
ncbi:MAG TPA: LOG family protein [Candidatus Saccharimonadales bacterium]|nr:LOG family protein [Candidatus Saccharimonadales bacterium]